MTYAANKLAQLTTQALKFDGGGSGGISIDKMEVAAVLGMKNAHTGAKLTRPAHYFARYIYIGDTGARAQLKGSLVQTMLNMDVGNIKDVTILQIINAAIREYKPKKRLLRVGQEELKPCTAYKLAQVTKMNKSSITPRHKAIFEHTVQKLIEYDHELNAHVKSHYFDNIA